MTKNKESSEPQNVLISIKDVWKNYGKLEVLKGLSLDVYEGETLVILGRSGVGKSVLLRQIIGIETPEKGTIFIDGEQLQSKVREAKDGSKKIGMLFQGSALFDSMNIAENTAFYLNQHEKHLSQDDISKLVSEALEMVGLKDVEKKMPSELSGGMRKRAALARMIVYRPSILLFDEPTTGLDPITAMQINNLINSIQNELKATSIVVTHDIRSAMEIGDRLAFHDEGKIIEVAPKAEFLQIKNPQLQSFFDNAILSPEYLKTPKGS